MMDSVCVPDMDDLLDKLEADVIVNTKNTSQKSQEPKAADLDTDDVSNEASAEQMQENSSAVNNFDVTVKVETVSEHLEAENEGVQNNDKCHLDIDKNTDREIEELQEQDYTEKNALQDWSDEPDFVEINFSTETRLDEIEVKNSEVKNSEVKNSEVQYSHFSVARLADEATENTGIENCDTRTREDEMSTVAECSVNFSNGSDICTEEVPEVIEEIEVIDEVPFELTEREAEEITVENVVPSSSVVTSTHDISASPVDRRLTQSEMTLGKVKPYWIPDSDSPACLLCQQKFGVFHRRHHCRCCGRVLCGSCCSKKSTLAYMNESKNKFKVCEPCFITLQKIELVEEENSFYQSIDESIINNQEQLDECPDENRVINGETSNIIREQCEASASDNSEQKQIGKSRVMFRDGLGPGQGTEIGGCPVIKPSKKPHRIKRGVSRRVVQLQLSEELACLLPPNEQQPPLLVMGNGKYQTAPNLDFISQKLIEGSTIEIAIKRNLSATVKIVNLVCCGAGQMWCICSRGLTGIGCEEMVFIFERDGTEVTIQYDILRLIDRVFETSIACN